MDKVEAQSEDVEDTFHSGGVFVSPPFYVIYLQRAAPRDLAPR